MICGIHDIFYLLVILLKNVFSKLYIYPIKVLKSSQAIFLLSHIVAEWEETCMLHAL